MAGKGKGKAKAKANKAKKRSPFFRFFHNASSSAQDAGVVDEDDDVVPPQHEDDDASQHEDDGVSQHENDGDSVPQSDDEGYGSAPQFIHNRAGLFRTITEDEVKPDYVHPFRMDVNKNFYPVHELSNEGNYVLTVEPYSCTLTEYLQSHPEPMQFIHRGSGYGKSVPQSWARRLARGIVKAFYELGDQEHYGLRLTDNYIVTVNRRVYRDNDLLKQNYYDEEITVHIVQNETELRPGKSTISPQSRRNAVMVIIFKEVFKNQNHLYEWNNFGEELKKGNLFYCVSHPCLWHWRERLIFYVKLWSAIVSLSLEMVNMVYRAITSCHSDDLYSHDWNTKIDHHPPLRHVLAYHCNDEEEMDAIAIPRRYLASQGKWQRWVEGVLLVKFIKNCYSHLTQNTWKHGDLAFRHFLNNELNEYTHYQDLPFLDHILTYDMYPRLLVALYGKLLVSGYNF